jgi:hypothetical protein
MLHNSCKFEHKIWLHNYKISGFFVRDKSTQIPTAVLLKMQVVWDVSPIRLFGSKDEDIIHLQNVGDYLPIDKK